MYTSVKAAVKMKSQISDHIISNTGVKQGDPCSSILFLMFVNDMVENINSNIEGIITINDIKFFLLSYADDQVLFSTSPTSLQSMLNDIENYCIVSQLKINTRKTKVLIFEKSNRHTNYNFYLYGELLEIVTSFKYLGITLFKNGNWYKTAQTLAERGNRSLHKLFTIINQYEFSTREQLNLFDKLVTPALHYSAEVWGFTKGKEIEIIHTKLLRKILKVNKSTNLAGMYGELGRYPLYIIRKLQIFRYWLKILKSSDNSITKTIYSVIFNDAQQNITYNHRNWASHIKNTLDELGLSNIWADQTTIINQTDQTFIYNTIKQRLLDNYKQSWYSEINNSPRLMSYCRFKNTFELEPYLDFITNKKYKTSLTRFRLSSHRLEIERGRYNNILRENRKCKFCNGHAIENEYHFLLVCPLYREIRKKHLKSYFQRWPTFNKFDFLMQSANKRDIISLAKYIFNANEMRNNIDNQL